MAKKYVTIKDVEKEINSSNTFVEFYEEDLKRERKRLENLNVLQNYLHEGGICPFSKKELLNDDKILQYYILPLKLETDKNFRYNMYVKKYLNKKSLIEVNCWNLEYILRDFIDFVRNLKSQRIEINRDHIIRYLNSREFV